MTLNELFKNTTYDDTLFSAEAKSAIESRIFMKSVRGSEVPYIFLLRYIGNKIRWLTSTQLVSKLLIPLLCNLRRSDFLLLPNLGRSWILTSDQLGWRSFFIPDNLSGS